MLQAGTFALTDPYTCLSSDVFPLMMFILIFIINASMAYQTGTAMNLARDLGPRLALYAVGFDHKMLWVHHHHFFWVPMVGPFIGALMGGWFTMSVFIRVMNLQSTGLYQFIRK